MSDTALSYPLIHVIQVSTLHLDNPQYNCNRLGFSNISPIDSHYHI